MKLAVQLYSVRDGIDSGDDLLRALENVKQAGYEGVEFAGTQGLPRKHWSAGRQVSLKEGRYAPSAADGV